MLLRRKKIRKLVIFFCLLPIFLILLIFNFYYDSSYFVIFIAIFLFGQSSYYFLTPEKLAWTDAGTKYRDEYAVEPTAHPAPIPFLSNNKGMALAPSSIYGMKVKQNVGFFIGIVLLIYPLLSLL